jgi:hypothetical protein
VKGGGDSARELIARLRDDLWGLLRLRSEGHSGWMHRRADGIREADRVTESAAAEGSAGVAATQHADELTDGPALTASRAARTPLTDLSHMPPLGDLYDGAHRDDLDDYDLTDMLRGLQRQYGPYRVEDLNAWYEGPWAREDGSIRPANVGFIAQIRTLDGEDAGSLMYSFTRDSEGALVVTHDHTGLDEGFTGKGFSTAFAASTEDYFRRSGVDRIELTATRLREGDSLDGAVAWAKSGYDWNTDPEKLAKSVDNMKSRIDLLLEGEIGALSDRDIALLEDMRSRFGGSPAGFPSPQELVMLAGDNTKLGEALMKGSTWYGMKML